jgi:hypothetical protein
VNWRTQLQVMAEVLDLRFVEKNQRISPIVVRSGRLSAATILKIERKGIDDVFNALLQILVGLKPFTSA